jgi:hypothetical protein
MTDGKGIVSEKAIFSDDEGNEVKDPKQATRAEVVATDADGNTERTIMTVPASRRR